jgi:hypothetical protein
MLFLGPLGPSSFLLDAARGPVVALKYMHACPWHRTITSPITYSRFRNISKNPKYSIVSVPKAQADIFKSLLLT